MRSISTDPVLQNLFDRVLHHANDFKRTLPEMRFFILDAMEFTSLLEKNVYPVSPVNIWEGKNMVSKKLRIESGQESSIYYEVVQTGNPSYGYLNHTNNSMMQASVMAHVVGHCEFSELNVLKDTDTDRSEMIMHLVRKTNLGRNQMGDLNYSQFWNACESAIPLISPLSHYNLSNTIEMESSIGYGQNSNPQEAEEVEKLIQPISSTINNLFQNTKKKDAFSKDQKAKKRNETLNRKGYKIKAPCQDIFGFLRNFAPYSKAEKSILDYMYEVHKHQEFVIRTQIMNEGWAMYWEKKIMLELFKEKAVTGVIDYSKVFSGVCYPRPYFQRNPYHLGYNMWLEIEELYKKGKISIDFEEEKDQKAKDDWDRGDGTPPIDSMTHLVETVTDYEFLRRFLTPELTHKFHLNRVHKRMAKQIGITANDVIQEDQNFVWLDPEPIKDQMLNFFTHFYRPRIYVVDSDYQDGGLMLYHRNDSRKLKKDWIKPTLKNINMIWKAPVALVTDSTLYQYSSSSFKESKIRDVSFDQICERLRKDEKPIRAS